MTLGPGTFGGSIISENVSAKHMFNVKRLAFETRPINPAGDTGTGAKSSVASGSAPKAENKAEVKPATSHNPTTPVPKPAPTKSWMEEIEERIRLKAANAPPKKEDVIEKASGPLGSGIAEEEVEKIMKEFSKR
jgi:hypothetical protein